MPPAPKERPARGYSLCARLLAVSLCLTLAACQSHDTRDMEQASYSKDRIEPFAPADQWFEQPAESSEPQDIWERVRAGFKLQDQLDANPRIEQQRLLLASRTSTIEISSERSAPYIHYIVERLEEQDMPLELALLPVIESAYNPFAYSRAHAVGLWQFIPSTGLHFDLRQTHWYDGRRDITASTNAALRYLSYLNELFNGDWLLALAAYNAGEGTVSRAIERNQKAGKPTDFWSLDLPKETRDYVPKLLALSALVMAPEQYGINLSPVANEPYFEVVEMEHRLDLRRIAKMAEIEEEELYRLNPAYTRRITFDGPKLLLVPAEKVELLESNLALMKGDDLIDWQQYRVRPGDTLGGIANRHQLTVRILKEVNRLESNVLRVGQVLSIPSAGPASDAPQVLQASATTSSQANYRVRNGDTLWTIARAHNVSVRDIQRWNNLSGSALKIGQPLRINGAKAVTVALRNDDQAKGKAGATYYKVKKGDSLYDIARRFNIQLGALQRWNPDSKILKPGQLLTLYLPQ